MYRSHCDKTMGLVSTDIVAVCIYVCEKGAYVCLTVYLTLHCFATFFFFILILILFSLSLSLSHPSYRCT